MKIFIDGKLLNEGNAKISVFDHGLLYGDGVFEGIRAYNGRVFKMNATAATIRANKLSDAYVRLVVTRGVGNLGLNPRSCPKPTVIIIAGKIQVYPAELYARGMEIVTVPTVRNLHSALNPAIKSLNYLNNILAKIEANNAGVEEAVMLNAEGFVAECTADNLFIIKNGELLTPPLSAGALYGITRGTVMELAAQNGMKVSEPNLTRYDLFNADECFLTGTGAEIMPVIKIDGRVIGSGKPGAHTAKLIKGYKALVQSTGEPIYK
jgi:branched-chain amino acid aminotransferase